MRYFFENTWQGRINFSYSYLLFSNKSMYMFEITTCYFCALGPAYVGIVGGASLLGFYEQERQLFGSLVSVCWASNAERVGCCIARVPQGRMKQGRFCIAGFLPPRQTERPSFMRGPLPLQLHVARCVLSYPPSPQTNVTHSILNRPPFTERRATRPTRRRSPPPRHGGTHSILLR